MIRYTDEERAFLINFIPGHIAEEVVEAFKKEFGKSINSNQVKYFRKNNSVKCERNTRFRKGQDPPNKGKKMGEKQYALCKKTMFKKGNRPINYKL